MEKSADVKKTYSPNFFLGLFCILLMFAGIILKENGYRGGEYVLLSSFALGGIHWLWAIIDVFRHQSFASQSKKFWIILVLVLPGIGGMMYYSMSHTVRM